MMRREIRASDNRHIYFEMRNAIAAEQTRILTTWCQDTFSKVASNLSFM